MSRMRRTLATLAAGTVVAMVGIGIGTWGTRAVMDPASTAVGGGGAMDVAAPANPIPVPRGDGWVAWGARPDGTPLRWDPCTPIDWTVRAGDPPWLPALAEQALEVVGAPAGLRFRRVEPHAVGVGPARPTATDGHWQPVLVTLTTPSESTWLTSDDRALAVPVEVGDVFVTGQVLLNADVELATDFSSRDGSWGATLLHEVGHLVGLDHVDDPSQLLDRFPQPGPATLGDGDRRGLTALRAEGACLDVPVPRNLVVETPRRRQP